MDNNSDDTKIGRRSFLQAAGVVAGSAIASTALSYDRILGANDRIALGHIGIGNRGSELHAMVSKLKDKYNVETVAVCDLWTNNRERAVDQHHALLRPRAAGDSGSTRAAGAQERRRRHDRHAGALALADAEGRGRGRQGRLLREADGQRAGGGQGGTRRRQAAQPRRADRHAASQRALPARGEGGREVAASSGT